ncbi:dihydroorotase [Gilvimarinus sp. SDUM040013]|uniref:Dihydroorotase n=1 Tax=Gilvimarinus gilvus TaxID=3058038 RepID=A0ABU4RXS3_9GAMM|nr:dihydroorotase [Gilvimarinus sp. SDUM040013]MDO3388214.1 dihydroorotase [Gilvimarinus sp. SDUM040013]MDX6847764.1 dihydroorotase [Gilvimarinus sp. SDUM040013]
MTNEITLLRPDDWHIHLRDGDSLARTVPDAAAQFARSIVMPNLVPPVTNADQARAYRERIVTAVPANARFEPLMVLYLTDNTQPEDIAAAKAAGVVACKLYPAGATTNSDSGVTDVKNIYPVLDAMQREGLLFLVHGEVTDSAIDIFDREKIFLETILSGVVKDFPELKIVLEHITTQDAAEFVKAAGPKVAATITAHHLLYNRNHMLVGGIKPHYYCLPILKRMTHQDALIAAATSGNPKFFLGTDSAPHAKSKKEAACGCAGSYTAYSAIELYAEAFERAGALDKLEGFASHFGPDFYGLTRNTDTVTLKREPWQLPQTLPYLDETIVPLCAGETLNWKLARNA